MDEKVIIYADGSCLGNHKRKNYGGWAALLLWRKKQLEISGAAEDTTNNRMELTSCIKALETLKTDNLKVEIYMDSGYVINAFNKGWLKKWLQNGWKKSDGKRVENQDLWINLLEQINRQKEVVFFQVKAHYNDLLNNRVDCLARQAANEIKKSKEDR